jgi:hypothetical protein
MVCPACNLGQLRTCGPGQPRCDSCGHADWQPLTELLLCLPKGRAFWREPPRILTLPPRQVETAGRPALITGYQSMLSSARLDIVVDRDSYAVLAAHRDPPA